MNFFKECKERPAAGRSESAGVKTLRNRHFDRLELLYQANGAMFLYVFSPGLRRVAPQSFNRMKTVFFYFQYVYFLNVLFKKIFLMFIFYIKNSYFVSIFWMPLCIVFKLVNVIHIGVEGHKVSVFVSPSLSYAFFIYFLFYRKDNNCKQLT